jgi:hypothetical protein
MSEQYFDQLTSKNDAISLAKKLAEDVQHTYFDLGCILYYVKERDDYKLIDNKKYYSENHSKWKQFCEDTLPVSYRTAQYWLNLYRYFTDMGIDKSVITKVGWSKAKELIDFTEDTNILNHALHIADTQTMQQLKAYVAEVKAGTEKSGEDTREEVKFKEFKFKFYEAAADSFDEILQEAMKDASGDKNSAIFKIAIEWYQNRQIEQEVASNVDDYVLVQEDESIEEELDRIL